MKMIDSTGQTIDVLPVGTRVRHIKDRRLTGKIMGHEFHEGGQISPLPYLVYWDNSELARKVIGLINIYPPMDKVEILESEPSA